LTCNQKPNQRFHYFLQTGFTIHVLVFFSRELDCFHRFAFDLVTDLQQTVRNNWQVFDKRAIKGDVSAAICCVKDSNLECRVYYNIEKWILLFVFNYQL